MIIRFLIPLLFIFPIYASADTGLEQLSNPGLMLKYEAGGGVILADSDVDWSKYTRVKLDRAKVTFRENWVRDQKRRNDILIEEADLEQLKTDMSDLLDKILTRKLTDSEGYTLTNETGADVLRFTPRIERLDIYSPGGAKNFVGHVLTDSQGNMVLVMEIIDSVSGTLLATALQRLADAESGYYEETNEWSNRQAFRKMMNRWTDWLVQLFDIVRAGPTESVEIKDGE